ncbi:3490_t:CDS:2 [Ambispora gerdemannii]|uniref:3490_t:CDS:1 n=1 Tax=Ambispora gerdemannii TaxID=144530 RepID=A0A9N9C2N1_9GLOM|nr:3490_t:CDS:2 [Ambispora gerdemannii]
MQFIPEETKSGWLTKQGGNALRKTWKKRWCEVKGNYLYYYRQQGASEPSGVIHLSSYNAVVHDPSATKKSQYCIRIEKLARSSDSVRSTLSYRDVKSPNSFIAYAESEGEMRQWIAILQKRVGDRNIVDIVLDRLDLNASGHRRQGSYGSLGSFYSRNGSMNGSSSTLSSRRPSLDSLSEDTPSLDSRKSSIDSMHSGYQTGERPISTIVLPSITQQLQRSRPQSPNLGIGQPILRKPASHSCLQDRRTIPPSVNTSVHSRKLSLSFKDVSATSCHPSAPLIMVHGDNSKYTTSPNVVFFPDRNIRMRNEVESKVNIHSSSSIRLNSFESFNNSNDLYKKKEEDIVLGSPVTPIRNVFPSHLSDSK